MNKKIKVLESELYTDYLEALKDKVARKAIDNRVLRFQSGNFGDCKSCGEGVLEARIHVGPGYRIYMKQKGSKLIILLCAGDKSTQKQDIELAKDLAKQV